MQEMGSVQVNEQGIVCSNSRDSVTATHSFHITDVLRCAGCKRSLPQRSLPPGAPPSSQSPVQFRSAKDLERSQPLGTERLQPLGAPPVSMSLLQSRRPPPSFGALLWPLSMAALSPWLDDLWLWSVS